ncbi:MAG: glycosyltransferase family 2 protein [Candidatus Izemoplasmatales bacterium]|jgi:glycosyltransferase involved in cell wall biosynthesis
MISILIPVYNEEKYIRECINSILDQSYTDFEIIIVNDQSIDNTLEILNEFAKADKRVNVLSPGKVGKNGALNLAAKTARGEWFMTFGGDDVMEPNILEKWYAIAKKYDSESEKVIISSKIRMFSTDPKYRKYNGLIIPKSNKKVVKSGAVFLGSKLVLDNAFPIPVDYPNEDTWLSLYIDFLVPKKIALFEICTNYRIHSNNSINKEEKFDEFNRKYHDRRKILGEFLNKFREELNNEDIDNITWMNMIEEYRYRGKACKIFLLKGINWKEKARNIFLSNKTLYRIKIILNRLLLGRI